MNPLKSVYFIGCGVLAPDINHIAKKQNLTFKKKFLPGGLHERPEELKQRLQAAIDDAAADETCQRIIVGYGLCGKGAVGIHAPPGVSLVFPKVHDCISLFLGSNQAYQKEFKKFPGTYYISNGWYTEKTEPKKGKPDQVWVGSQAMGCKEITDTYGDKDGKDIIRFFNAWQKNYQRAAFIDTGTGHTERSEKHARKMAEKHNWIYQRIEGSLSLMTRLVTATVSDDQILVVPPGYVTTYSAVENGLSAAPRTLEGMQETSGSRFLVFDKSEDKGVSIQYGLGIDAGGTYTDAAVYDFHSQALHSKNKALTTKWDFSIGIDNALSRLDKATLARVGLVSVSTTLATNAIVENEGQKAGLILMYDGGKDADRLIPHTPKAVVKGRLNIKGEEIQAVDHNEIRHVASQMVKQQGVAAFAVSGYAGAANPAHELEVKAVIQEETGKVVTCGHELSSLLNFVVRAQTAVLNARIILRMMKFFEELDSVLKKREIDAPVMVVKGDGTLMSAAMARERPVETILSGPAASVAGARLLTGLDNAMVVDIGGTTTDTADLSDGLVTVCAHGARVGGIATHVKALDMQTVGLGGDSLIRMDRETLCIGPRRVAPVVWADSMISEGIDEALTFMELKRKRSPSTPVPHTILAAMEGEFPFEPTPEERRMYKILRQRPHALDELPDLLNLLSANALPIERLEGSGLVQRCGLTPTDILHINGRFEKWRPDAARRMVKILARPARMQPDAFIEHVLKQFEFELAKELLKKQLAKSVPVDEDAETPLSAHLMACMLSGGQDGYRIEAFLDNPVIGIGAPAHFFLPNAGKKLNARVIIPDDADVANALGAISSHIMIRQQVTIRPDDTGGFRVDGIEGGQVFNRIDTAEKWAVDRLKTRVQELGRFAGTSRKTVEMEIKDRIVNVGNDTSLFLDRTLSATLSGSPDLVLQTVMAG